jgi:hypothetical protein
MKMPLSQTSIKVLPLITFKWGPDTLKQATVMSRVRRYIEPRLAPPVLWSWSNGYAMPTYKNNSSYHWLVAELGLSVVWTKRERMLLEGPQFDPEALDEFLEGCESPLLGLLSKPHLDLYYRHADEATHGDCTAENTLARGYARSDVFIDWQWQRRPFIPAHRAVDYGKLMQSLLGWETLGTANHQEIKELLRRCPDAWFWCGVHLERILKRSTNAAVTQWCETNVRLCIEFGKRKVYP